jgi:hydroxymethylpyrimidine pyrophosphatase-like HAD family hydrolase
MEKILILFDLDDTLTPKGDPMKDFMYDKLDELKNDGRFNLAVLTTTGESNMMKQLKTESGQDAIPLFDYLMAENGLVVFKVTDGTAKEIAKKTIIEEVLTDFRIPYFHSAQGFINEVIAEKGQGLQEEAQNIARKQNKPDPPSIEEFLSQEQNPQQVLKKVAMFNFTPIGTNKDRVGYDAYRAAFKELNTGNAILEPLRQRLEKRWNQIHGRRSDAPKLEFTVGGSTGVDASPPAWNKSYGYIYLKDVLSPKKVYFFGDNAIKPTGNDFKVCEQVMNEQCKFCCFKVGGPRDTEQYLTLILAGYDPDGVIGDNNPQTEHEITRQLNDFKAALKGGTRRKKSGKKRKTRRKRKTRKRRKRRTKRKHKKRRRTKRR